MKALFPVFLFAFLLSGALSAQATNVLLPESGSSSEAPKSTMGLSSPVTPKQSAPSTSSSTATQNGAIKPGGTVSNKNLKVRDALTAGQITSGAITTTKKPLSDFELRAKSFFDAERKKQESDPAFVREFQVDQNELKGLKASLVVAASDQYLWGPRDLRIIEKRLGYTASEVPQNCQLRFDVDLDTETGDPLFSGVVATGTKKAIKYDGSALRGAAIQPNALCKPPSRPLPRNGGIITKVGSMFSLLLLGGANCQVPPNTKPSSLDVQYLGDGVVSCQFK